MKPVKPAGGGRRHGQNLPDPPALGTAAAMAAGGGRSATIPAMAHKLLETMLDRLYGSLASGPALNCRPHSSRQRVDLAQLALLEADEPPGPAPLAALLGEPGKRAWRPRLGSERALRTELAEAAEGEELRPESRPELQRRALLTRLRTIAEEALGHERETGTQVLFVGYPLLQLPPRKGPRGEGRRVLAPVAFIPVSLEVVAGVRSAVTLTSTGLGPEKVVPNPALMAWLEQQTGRSPLTQPEGESEAAPWVELQALTDRVAAALELPTLALNGGEAMAAVPRREGEAGSGEEVSGLLDAAVLGLFPMGQQNVVEDLKAMVGGESLVGPVEAFLSVGAGLAQPSSAPASVERPLLVTTADPCQARAVALARRSRGLVIHGPPGTGKSQTIANVIGDHLARGERVLFVCDKRTALDVVHHRLGHLGLSELCAVIHDARHDQRELYLSIRKQLDDLPETKPQPAGPGQLATLERELGPLRERLTRHLSLLDGAGAEGEGPLHDLIGDWLGTRPPPAIGLMALQVGLPRVEAFDAFEQPLRSLHERGIRGRWGSSPWRGAVGVGSAALMSRSPAALRSALEALATAAQALDASPHAEGLPFDPLRPLAPQVEARSLLRERLEVAFARLPAERVAAWCRAPSTEREASKGELESVAAPLALVREAPLDGELALLHRSAPVALSEALQGIGRLGSYLEVARRWYRFLFFRRTREAREVLQRFGLLPSAETAERGRRFLEAIRARHLVAAVHRRLLREPDGGALPEDAALRASVEGHAALFAALELMEGESLRALRPALLERLQSPAQHAALLDGLRSAGPRVEALEGWRRALEGCQLFESAFIAAAWAEGCAGARQGAAAARFVEAAPLLEDAVRVREGLAGLPPPLARSFDLLLQAGHPFEGSWSGLRRACLAECIAARLAAHPELLGEDATSLQAAFDQVESLERSREQVARAEALEVWRRRQRERLLASTGGRLNGAGAEVRRRLLLRGERAMKVRQVIVAGAGVEGGDPLFDLRPVWMASPATVCQLFPRAPLFDVVVFDEASQCRLEEALPVLTRARRVVIAGDPKQLPPTRFFESAVVQNEVGEAEGAQELFEEQLSEVEDLLGAALDLEVDQAFLDVHYRSRNADLISFSNEAFYGSRLQPIPGHPRHRAVQPPIELVRVEGTYEKRVNLREAEAVVARVKELLAAERPPSIGIACFNLGQRDLVLEVLDRTAEADPAFASRLAEARARQGAGSFEGLFVKNLENVQGDERDHLLISTTYGPDPKGRFFRRFGPLGQAGGGRRLNVLVTRARERVHLFTSIPRAAWSQLPPLEPGRAPNGAWLLLAYLKQAEALGTLYADPHGRRAQEALAEGSVTAWSSGSPSRVAVALAQHLAEEARLASETHWGNDGFCIDVALRDPRRRDLTALGLLCDGNRFRGAEDRLAWELFRTRLLTEQGWKLERLLSPHLFRDLQGSVARVVGLLAPGRGSSPELTPPHGTTTVH